MIRDHIQNLISQFGADGFPQNLNKEFADTWNLYPGSQGSNSTPKERILNVLGFLHLLNQAGEKLTINPYKAYEAIVDQEYGNYANLLAAELRKARVFDLFKVYKVHFDVDYGLRGTGAACLSICVDPRKAESLDSALHKAEGYLYRRDVPVFLQERWKRMGIKSKALKPKSALPKFMDMMKNTSSVSGLPLYLKDNCSLHVARSAGDKLVFKFRVVQPMDRVTWLNRHAHTKLLQRIWINSFKNLGGIK